MSRNILALDYLTKDTFDVPSKTMLARELLEDRMSWGAEVYREVLRVWNGFREGTKFRYRDFLGDFDDLLCDMKHGHFNWEDSPIPTYQGRICNGRHRYAAALALGQHICTKETGEGPADCPWDYFAYLGLAPLYMDSIAIEFCRLKSSARIAAVFGEHSRSELLEALGVQAFYEKKVQLIGPTGPLNVIRELYHGEPWLEMHARTKAKQCYADLRGLLTVYVLDVRGSDDELRHGKERVRAQVGHHGIHINDTHAETMRIARALLNDNGVHFLNHAFSAGVGVPQDVIGDPDVPVDTGSVLAAYGLRGASDVDYVSDDMHLEHHSVSLQALKDDPRNFFWSRGVKYASLPAVMRMKLNRGELKDQADIKLIGGIL